MNETTLAYAMTVQEMKPGRGEDRATAVRLPDRTIFALADGAGGVAGGAAAASFACAAIDGCLKGKKPTDWANWLRDLDRTMASSPSSGLAAIAIVEIVDDGTIVGASAGDCDAWVFDNDNSYHLTAEQKRKPLLGSGNALPVSFSSRLAGGRLVIASDGLWKYMPCKQIAKTISVRSLDNAINRLVAGIRLRNGMLQDDVAVLVCEESSA